MTIKKGTIVDLKIYEGCAKNPHDHFLGIVMENIYNQYIKVNWVAGGPNFRNIHPGYDFIGYNNQVLEVLGEIEEE